ncbi:hypothetical protein [Saccharothrix lopnurensis]|uniref:Membrane protein (TIGR02234 family) n=1 Tax=Saccharothrix lopnurensis TaxID=1670621 RepID=A0ABW1PGZ3_9PSEU
MTRRAVAVGLLVVGALLVLLGSLFPLFAVEQVELFGPGGREPDSRTVTVGITGWEVVRDPEPDAAAELDGEDPVYGYALVVAALLAGAGAVLRVRTPRQAVVGGLAAGAGAGLVAGVLWAVVETWSVLFGGPLPDEGVRTFVGAGGYLLGVAVALVVAGAVLGAEWPPRAPRTAGDAVHRVDDDATPPFGIAVPVIELGPVEADRDHPTG